MQVRRSARTSSVSALRISGWALTTKSMATRNFKCSQRKISRTTRLSSGSRINHRIALFQKLEASVRPGDQIFVLLVGHGSFRSEQSRFNLPGPDLTGGDISEALDSVNIDNIVFVNTSSASGALGELVQKERRVVALATRSGSERQCDLGNYAICTFFETADINKNKTVSVAEAFGYAERQVADYFERNGQLATEHAVLHGERADRFALAKLNQRPADPRPSPATDRLAELLEQRDALNAEIDALRLTRDEMPALDYQAKLMPKLLELARLESDIEAEQGGAVDD